MSLETLKEIRESLKRSIEMLEAAGNTKAKLKRSV